MVTVSWLLAFVPILWLVLSIALCDMVSQCQQISIAEAFQSMHTPNFRTDRASVSE